MTAVDLFLEKAPGAIVEVMPLRGRVLRQRMAHVADCQLHRPHPVQRLYVRELSKRFDRRKELIGPAGNREDRDLPVAGLLPPALILVEGAAQLGQAMAQVPDEIVAVAVRRAAIVRIAGDHGVRIPGRDGLRGCLEEPVGDALTKEAGGVAVLDDADRILLAGIGGRTSLRGGIDGPIERALVAVGCQAVCQVGPRIFWDRHLQLEHGERRILIMSRAPAGLAGQCPRFAPTV